MHSLTSALLAAAATLYCLADVNAAGGFDPNYYVNEWGGTCATGKMQTPIDLPPRYFELDPVTPEAATILTFPVVKDPIIKNVGHAIQVTWDLETAFDMSDDTIFPMLAVGGNSVGDIVVDSSIPVERRVKLIPIQFHWHATSEHAWDGMLAAAELHIVTLVGPGEAPEWGCDEVWNGGLALLDNCTSVFGIMYRLGAADSTPANFKTFLAESPLVAGEEQPLSMDTLDLNELLPYDLSYYSYVGSLTTPECNEGLRWHVFHDHPRIEVASLKSIEDTLANTVDPEDPSLGIQGYRHNERPIQPLNDRTVYFWDSGSARYPGALGDVGYNCGPDGTPAGGPGSDSYYGYYGSDVETY